jgi:outer membrane protein insertion porin family
LIISERFFSGGSRSMRGFKRHRLGPKDGAGNPLGGQFLFEASTELRLPLYRSLRWALFVDTAQVWRDVDRLLTGGLEWAAGVGVVFRTPVGPIRFDWGHRLGSVEDGEPASVLHFSVGHPF